VALAAALLVTADMATPALLYFRAPGDQDAFQFRIPVYGLNQSDIAVSPNGETLALVARPDPPEAAALYVRPVAATAFRRVAGTDDAALPFWSADSRSIGFVAGGRLKKVAASGGPPQNIGDAQGFTGGAWNSSGTIVFGTPKGLFRVSAEGGKPEAITSVEKPETGHYWPNFLPDGRHYVYLACRRSRNRSGRAGRDRVANTRNALRRVACRSRRGCRVGGSGVPLPSQFGAGW